MEKKSIQEAEHLGHLIVKRSPIKMATQVEKKIKCLGPCHDFCGDLWQKKDQYRCQRCIKRNPDCEEQLIKWESQKPKKRKPKWESPEPNKREKKERRRRKKWF